MQKRNSVSRRRCPTDAQISAQAARYIAEYRQERAGLNADNPSPVAKSLIARLVGVHPRRSDRENRRFKDGVGQNWPALLGQNSIALPRPDAICLQELKAADSQFPDASLTKI
jgi:hypothetical protein